MQETMFNEHLSPLSFGAGLAILTNASAIMQNGATTRYNLAVTQWREFCASVGAQDGRLSREYLDPDSVVALAGRRIRLQLCGLGLLNAAVALFAATTVLGLVGAFLVQLGSLPSAPVSLAMVIAGAVSLLLLLASTVTFFLETACGWTLLGLHRHGDEGPGTESEPGNFGGPGHITPLADRVGDFRRNPAS